MSTLKEQLEREVQKRGQNSPVAQLLRNQIAAEQKGKSFQELYLQKPAEQEDNPDFVVELLRKTGLPVTRENYLDLAYPDGVPDDLDETSLPQELRQ